jgi:hypothetical protein
MPFQGHGNECAKLLGNPHLRLEGSQNNTDMMIRKLLASVLLATKIATPKISFSTQDFSFILLEVSRNLRDDLDKVKVKFPLYLTN